MGFFNRDQEDRERQPSMLDNIVQLTPDHPVTIQILEPKVGRKNVIWRHYIPQALRKSGKRGIPIVCPGMDICPVCRHNAELGDKKHPEYISPQKRIVVNVLDLTLVRTCPICEMDNNPKVKECENCGYVFDADDKSHPLNKVKLLDRGTTLFTQLNTVDEAVSKLYKKDDPLNDPEIIDYSNVSEGDTIPVGIVHYPITLVVSKDSKGQQVITPLPGQVNDVNWRNYQDELLKPEDCFFTLTPVEIQELVDGGSLSDVLKSRSYESVSESRF